jgi:hypothetical protein
LLMLAGHQGDSNMDGQDGQDKGFETSTFHSLILILPTHSVRRES